MPILLLPVDFIKWYFTQLPRRLLHFFINTNLWLENSWAIRLHLRLFFVPLFHDRTIVGRMLSVWFRAARVFGGTLLLFAVDCVLAPVLLLWLVVLFLPFVRWYYVFLWPLLFIAYCLFVYGQPRKKVLTIRAANQIPQATTKAAKRLLANYTKQPIAALEQFATTAIGKLYFAKLAVALPNVLQGNAPAGTYALPRVAVILDRAYQLAKAESAAHVTDVHVATAILQDPVFAPGFAKAQVTIKELEAVSQWLTELTDNQQTVRLWDDEFFQAKLSGVNRGWLGVPTPELDRISTDLTQQAMRHQLQPVIGRDKTVQTMLQVLSRAQRENVLITGQSGSGKTSVVYKIAQQIVAGTVPKSLFSKRLIQLNVGDLVASLGPGQSLEAKIKEIIAEIETTGNVILFIDDIHALAAVTTPAGEVNALALFKPYLSLTKFQIIGATSTANYERYIEPYKDFASLFQIVAVEEVTEPEAVHILELESLQLENRHGVLISIQAIEAAVSLAQRYIHDRVLPGKAYDLLDEACVAVASTTPSGLVTARHIESVVEQKTNVPVHDATNRERDTLLHLEAKIHEHMIDQETAVKAVADALRRARTGITNEHRPIASFLFVGPTGVGKTELAKALARVYFGREDSMVRFDMSEFQEQTSIYRLLGTPMAQGNETPQPGQLTEAVRQKPFALLLFDEIEKTHPSILDLFLQILEDGRLTDSSGNTVTFQDTIIIATSNAGTQTIEQSLQRGITAEQLQQSIFQILNPFFRIEFLNRFDELVVFKPLTLPNMVAITTLLLKQLAEEMHQKGYDITFSPDLVQALAQRGYNPMLGARPLRRLIQEEVESQIAKLILGGQLQKNQPVVFSSHSLGQAQKPFSSAMN